MVTVTFGFKKTRNDDCVFCTKRFSLFSFKRRSRMVSHGQIFVSRYRFDVRMRKKRSLSITIAFKTTRTRILSLVKVNVKSDGLLKKKYLQSIRLQVQ